VFLGEIRELIAQQTPIAQPLLCLDAEQIPKPALLPAKECFALLTQIVNQLIATTEAKNVFLAEIQKFPAKAFPIANHL